MKAWEEKVESEGMLDDIRRAVEVRLACDSRGDGAAAPMVLIGKEIVAETRMERLTSWAVELLVRAKQRDEREAAFCVSSRERKKVKEEKRNRMKRKKRGGRKKSSATDGSL